jgi:hypothetical protein
MNSSNWPYWLKGAIIFLIYSLIFSAFFWEVIGFNLENSPDWVRMIVLILSMPALAYGFWLCGIGGLSDGVISCNYSAIWQFVYAIPLFVSFFILGSFIGWFYGKIKSVIHKIKNKT